MKHGKHAADLAPFTFPTTKEVATLAIATVVIAGLATAAIWTIDLGLTAGVSLM